jgi:hypothetical protein
LLSVGDYARDVFVEILFPVFRNETGAALDRKYKMDVDLIIGIRHIENSFV